MIHLAPPTLLDRVTGGMFRLVGEARTARVKAAMPRPLLRLWCRARGVAYTPPVGRVRFGDLRRLSPVSRHFGFDRGRPVDRYYIEAFLARHRVDINGRVLEIKDSAYTTRFGGDRVVQRDVLDINRENPRATIVADLTHAEHVASEQFDCVIVTQTLHYIFDIDAAVRTLHRLLKRGGVLLATVPAITRTAHTKPEETWYWSLTRQSTQRLFQEVFAPATVTVEAYGNVLAATAFLHGLAAEELEPDELDYRDADYELIVAVRALKP